MADACDVGGTTAAFVAVVKGLELDELVDGGGTVRGGIDVADREGPSFDATRADLSMNFLYSYLPATTVSGISARLYNNLPLIYCSISLSRSVSSRFGGGGWRNSLGL